MFYRLPILHYHSGAPAADPGKQLATWKYPAHKPHGGRPWPSPWGWRAWGGCGFVGLWLCTGLLTTAVAATTTNPWPDDRPVPLAGDPWQLVVEPTLAAYFRSIKQPRTPADIGPGMLVKEILAGAPPGLQAGDRIIGAFGYWIRNNREYSLLHDLVSRRPDCIPVVVERAGRQVQVEMTPVNPLFRMGCLIDTDWSHYDARLTSNDQRPFLIQVLALAGQVPEGSQLWAKGFPETPAWDLAVHLAGDAKPALDWLRPAITLYRRMIAQDLPGIQQALADPALERIPLPSWRKLVAFYQALVTQTGAAHADPAACGVDPIYYVLHYPHWQYLPELGNFDSKQPEFLQFLRILHQNGGIADHQMIKPCTAMVRRFFLPCSGCNNSEVLWEKLAGTFLMQHAWTENHWRLLSCKEQAQLRVERDTDPLRAAMVNIHQALERFDGESVAKGLTHLAGQSPFLGVFLMAYVQSHMDGKTGQPIRAAMEPLIKAGRIAPAPPRGAYYERLAYHEDLAETMLCPAWYPGLAELVDGKHDAKAVQCFIGPEAFLSKIHDQDYNLVNPTNDQAWAFNTDPRFADAEAAISFQEDLQEFLTCGDGANPVHQDTMAACYAARQQWTKAIHWQEAAVYWGQDMGNARFTVRLNILRTHKPIIDSGPALERKSVGGLAWHEVAGKAHGPLEGRDEAGRLLVSGFLNEGQRFGRWRTFDAQGRALTWGDFFDNQPHGLWRHARPDGTTLALGHWHRCPHKWHRKGYQWGFWRYYHQDGTTVAAEGWYIGNAPGGPWRFWRPDGSLLAAGGMMRGKPVGPWEWRDEAGRPAPAGVVPTVEKPQCSLGRTMADERFPGNSTRSRSSSDDRGAPPPSRTPPPPIGNQF